MSDNDGLDVGETVPAVSAQLVDPDGTTETVSLESLYTDTPVLLAFYPNDFSPDCIKEWCSFRDYDWFSTGSQVQVVGASKSRPFTHKQFIGQLNLGFSLFSDTDLEMADAFDVRYRTLKLFERPRRSVFLLGSEGTVRYNWISEHPVDPSRDTPDVSEVHRAVAEQLGGPDSDSFGFD